LLEKTGFRVALRLPGMTTFSCFQEFCKKLSGFPLWRNDGVFPFTTQSRRGEKEFSDRSR
jgi:hypothetical protein